MERRNSKGKKPFNYKRNRSNSGSSYSSTDNKKNFKHPRGKNDRNNIENSNHKKFNNGHSTKKNKFSKKNYHRNYRNSNYEASSSYYIGEASSSTSHFNYHSHSSNNSSDNINNNNSDSNSNNNNNDEPNILNIPGYYYDKEKKKYFKVQKNGLSTSEYSQSSVSQKEKEEKSKLQQDMEKLKIKNNNKNYNISSLIMNREMGIITGNKNIEKYIYNKLLSNIKCQQTTRHREISTISLSHSGKVIALGHVNGYASIKVRGQINNENSFSSCAKIASSKVSSLHVYENNPFNYNIFATSLGGEAEPGSLIIYKYQINQTNEEFNPLFSLIKKVTYKNSSIQCCSISDSTESFITIGDRSNALIHQNLQSICTDIKHHTVSMPIKTDILVQKNTQNHLLYNGCRNGNIEIIDLQNLKLNTHKNFVKHKSSLCDIQQINSSLFISNSMDGGIYIWDIRGGTSSHYSKNNHHNNHWVIQELYGNRNDYLKNNIAVDPNKNIVFTAGQDGQLRAWNIHNGEMILSKHLPNYTNNTPTTIQLDYSDSLIGFWTANSVNLSLWNLRF